MIKLTRINDSEVVVNSDLIEFIEALPDTILTLTTGQKVIVKETVDEIMGQILAYRQAIFSQLPRERGE